MMLLSVIYSLLSTSLLLCLDYAQILPDLCIVQAKGYGCHKKVRTRRLSGRRVSFICE